LEPYISCVARAGPQDHNGSSAVHAAREIIMMSLPCAVPIALVLALLSSTVSAQPEPEIAAKPAAKPPPKANNAKPVKPPPKRRAVWQVIEPVRPIGSAAPEPYRPTLTPPAPTVPRPPGPVQLNCDAAGCSDLNGTRYQGGVGNTLLDSQGRTCTRMGTTAQCF
jgi:hypothetical protein